MLLNVPSFLCANCLHSPSSQFYTYLYESCFSKCFGFLLSFILTSHILFQQHLMLHFFFSNSMSHLLCSPHPLPLYVSVHVPVAVTVHVCACNPLPNPTQPPPPMLLRRSRGGGSPPAQTNSSLSLKAMSWRRQATESRRGLQVNETRRESVRGGDG